MEREEEIARLYKPSAKACETRRSAGDALPHGRRQRRPEYVARLPGGDPGAVQRLLHSEVRAEEERRPGVPGNAAGGPLVERRQRAARPGSKVGLELDGDAPAAGLRRRRGDAGSDAPGRGEKSAAGAGEDALRTLGEGLCAQVMHVGPYAAERRQSSSCTRSSTSRAASRAGKHHEIYLGDPRRAAPEKLKTVVRQPVASPAGLTEKYRRCVGYGVCNCSTCDRPPRAQRERAEARSVVSVTEMTKEVEQTMADKVIIFDTTLRDGEQSPGVALNMQDKLEIARQLERLGVDVIEAGFPISLAGRLRVRDSDRQRRSSAAVVAGLAHADPQAVDACWEAVKGAAQPRIHIFLSSSDIHLAHQLRKDRDEVLEMARTQVARAKGYVSDVEFSADGRQPLRPGVPLPDAGAGDRGGRDDGEHPGYRGLLHAGGVRGVHPQHLREGARTSTRRSSRCTATTTWAWRWPTRWPPCRRGRARWSAASTASASGPGNASLEEIVMALKTRARPVRADDRHQDEGALPDEPPRLRPDGHGRPAEQGDRRRQRLPPPVGHPPGRHPEDARDLRDHGRARRSAGLRAAPSSCWASCRAGTPSASGCRRWATS